MDEKIKVLIAVLVTVGLFLIALTSGDMTGAAVSEYQMPAKQCYKHVLTRDNLVQQQADTECIPYGYELYNPCTGTYMDGVKFCNDKKILRRMVFENGDVKGLTHYKNYPESYVLCADGRAKVNTVKMPYVVRGIAYGLWYYNPRVSYQNQYTIEKCNTL